MSPRYKGSHDVSKVEIAVLVEFEIEIHRGTGPSRRGKATNLRESAKL